MHVKKSHRHEHKQPLYLFYLYFRTFSQLHILKRSHLASLCPCHWRVKMQIINPIWFQGERETAGNVTVKSCLNCAQPHMVHYNVCQPHDCHVEMSKMTSRTRSIKGRISQNRVGICLPSFVALFCFFCSEMGSLTFCGSCSFLYVFSHAGYRCLC